MARQADVAVVVIGTNESTSREAWADNHLGDVADLELVVAAERAGGRRAWHGQAGGGRPHQRAAARHPSQRRGDGARDPRGVLPRPGRRHRRGATSCSATYNPGGKLPITFPRATGQLPVYYDRKPTSFRSYLDLTREPLFPFGHGLSYTTFKLDEPEGHPGEDRARGRGHGHRGRDQHGRARRRRGRAALRPRPRRVGDAAGQGAARVRARDARSRRAQDGDVQGRPRRPALHRRAHEPRGGAGNVS